MANENAGIRGTEDEADAKMDTSCIQASGGAYMPADA